MLAMSIMNLKRGDEACILGFLANSKHAYRTKLLAMGLTPGTPFKVSRIAPLGDPIEILIRGYALSLRKKEAAILRIERVEHG